MNENKKTYSLDVAYYPVFASFADSLEALLDVIPEADIRVRAIKGSSGGWPTIEVTVLVEEILALKNWFLGEDIEVEDMDDYEVTEEEEA